MKPGLGTTTLESSFYTIQTGWLQGGKNGGLLYYGAVEVFHEQGKE